MVGQSSVSYVRFPANLCLQFSIGMAWGGPLFKSDSNERWGSKLRLLFKSFYGPLLKSGVGGPWPDIVTTRKS